MSCKECLLYRVDYRACSPACSAYSVYRKGDTTNS